VSSEEFNYPSGEKDVTSRYEGKGGFPISSFPMRLAADCRLVWMIDGYTTSDAHPYSRAVDVPDMGSVNYIRNAVKATVDAYDGEQLTGVPAISTGRL
jgi:uncharacterized membrane protein (UPF0182 family)